jgi:hypothetical protein
MAGLGSHDSKLPPTTVLDFYKKAQWTSVSGDVLGLRSLSVQLLKM